MFIGHRVGTGHAYYLLSVLTQGRNMKQPLFPMFRAVSCYNLAVSCYILTVSCYNLAVSCYILTVSSYILGTIHNLLQIKELVDISDRHVDAVLN